MATLEFVKMQGCGNDYIFIVASRARPADPPALSRRLSDRRFGVGADGIILLCPARRADVRMEMYNADGSRGEMCGNGIRCLARLAYERGCPRKNPLAIETDCGVKQVALRLDASERVVGATVDMGEPIIDARQVPAAAEGRLIDYPLRIGDRVERITALSMGNPHCVVMLDDEAVFALDDREFAKLGRQFESHPLFPHRTNTEFVLPVSRRELKMRVWERGSGETLACGTGACAALVAAVVCGRADRSASVALRGGTLEIEWRESGSGANHLFMTGDAVEVFRGQVEVEDRELAHG